MHAWEQMPWFSAMVTVTLHKAFIIKLFLRRVLFEGSMGRQSGHWTLAWPGHGSFHVAGARIMHVGHQLVYVSRELRDNRRYFLDQPSAACTGPGMLTQSSSQVSLWPKVLVTVSALQITEQERTTLYKTKLDKNWLSLIKLKSTSEMLGLSLTDTMLNLASSITSALIPRSDEILREASIVIIKMIGLTPPPSQAMIECSQKNHVQSQNESLQKKPKVRKCLKIHRNNNVANVRGGTTFFFNTVSYTKFLQYHRSKWMSIKSNFISTTNRRLMHTIHEEELWFFVISYFKIL